MKIVVGLISTFTFGTSMFAGISVAAIPQQTPVVPRQQTFTAPTVNQQQSPIVPHVDQQNTPIVPEKITTQKICSYDTVENLLSRSQNTQNDSNSAFSYLAQQGFNHNEDGSWACYVKDPRKDGRYYTLFKVQQIGAKLVGSSFLDNGTLIEGQDKRSLDFFMTLIEHQMKTTEGNRQSIQRYVETFISLVKEGKIPPSRRGYLFDQPSRGLILYHALTDGKLKGTAITINLNLSQ